MNIDNIITECLNGEKRRIIIPGFGAFIRRPGGELVFVDILNSDDGILAAEVQRRQGISGDEARRAVDKYSYHLKTELLYNKAAKIEGLGTLKMTADGSYELEPPAVPEAGQTDIPESERGTVVDLTAVGEYHASEEPGLPAQAEAGGEVTATEEPEDTDAVITDNEVAQELRTNAEEGHGIEESWPENAADISNTRESAEPVEESSVRVVEDTTIVVEEPETHEIITQIVPENIDHAGTEGGKVNETVIPQSENNVNEEPAGREADTGNVIIPETADRRSDREKLRDLLYGDEDVEIRDSDIKEDAEKPVEVKQQAGLSGKPDAFGELLREKEARASGRDGLTAVEPESQRPQVQLRRPKKKRMDAVIIVAIIAIVVAIAVLVYGEVTKSNLDVDFKEWFQSEN